MTQTLPWESHLTSVWRIKFTYWEPSISLKFLVVTYCFSSRWSTIQETISRLGICVFFFPWHLTQVRSFKEPSTEDVPSAHVPTLGADYRSILVDSRVFVQNVKKLLFHLWFLRDFSNIRVFSFFFFNKSS